MMIHSDDSTRLGIRRGQAFPPLIISGLSWLPFRETHTACTCTREPEDIFIAVYKGFHRYHFQCHQAHRVSFMPLLLIDAPLSLIFTTVCSEPQRGNLKRGWVLVSGAPVTTKIAIASCRSVLASVTRDDSVLWLSNVYLRSCVYTGRHAELICSDGSAGGSPPKQTGRLLSIGGGHKERLASKCTSSKSFVGQNEAAVDNGLAPERHLACSLVKVMQRPMKSR